MSLFSSSRFLLLPFGDTFKLRYPLLLGKNLVQELVNMMKKSYTFHTH
jgi:hypothetical protein